MCCGLMSPLQESLCAPWNMSMIVLSKLHFNGETITTMPFVGASRKPLYGCEIVTFWLSLLLPSLLCR